MGVSSFEFGFAFGAIVRRLMGQGFGCFKRGSIEMLLRYIVSEVRDPRDRTLKTTYYRGFSLPQFSAGFTCGSIEAGRDDDFLGLLEVFRRFYLRLH